MHCKVFELATYPYIHEYKGYKKLAAQIIAYRHKYLKNMFTALLR